MIKHIAKQILLIDANNYIHRLYQALPHLTTDDGQHINAVYGFCKMLVNNIIPEFQNTKTIVAVVFDQRSEHRKKLYSEYKANRSPMTNDLASQIQIIKDCVKKLGLMDISVSGHEADDVISTYASQAEQEGMKVIIASNDKDLLQLVNKNIQIFNPSEKKMYDRNAVKDKMKVFPEQIVDFLALVGDSSDNINGVPGIGPVTAASLLEKHGNIDEMLCSNSIPEKISKKLEDFETQLYINRQLIKLRRDVNLTVPLQELPLLVLNKTQELYNFCKRYSFSSIINKLGLANTFGEHSK